MSRLLHSLRGRLHLLLLFFLFLILDWVEVWLDVFVELGDLGFVDFRCHLYLLLIFLTTLNLIILGGHLLLRSILLHICHIYLTLQFLLLSTLLLLLLLNHTQFTLILILSQIACLTAILFNIYWLCCKSLQKLLLHHCFGILWFICQNILTTYSILLHNPGDRRLSFKRLLHRLHFLAFISFLQILRLLIVVLRWWLLGGLLILNLSGLLNLNLSLIHLRQLPLCLILPIFYILIAILNNYLIISSIILLSRCFLLLKLIIGILGGLISLLLLGLLLWNSHFLNTTLIICIFCNNLALYFLLNGGLLSLLLLGLLLLCVLGLGGGGGVSTGTDINSLHRRFGLSYSLWLTILTFLLTTISRTLHNILRCLLTILCRQYEIQRLLLQFSYTGPSLFHFSKELTIPVVSLVTLRNFSVRFLLS